LAQDRDDMADNIQYKNLQQLEDLESLLEELEEEGITGLEPDGRIPDGLKARMSELGLRDVVQLRDSIMHLHAELDRDDNELTISDS
jgi:hypothetical protein